MTDLDELERLLKAARVSPGSTPIRLTALSATAQECDALIALRNAAAELIRDARLWREHCYIESQTSRSPNP